MNRHSGTLIVALTLSVVVTSPAFADALVEAVSYQILATPTPGAGGFQTHAALDGNLLAVSTNTTAATPGSGAVLLYSRSGARWDQDGALQPAGRVPSDLFGERVDVDGDVAVVGAPGENNNGLQPGAVWVFRKTGGTWHQEAKLVAPEAVPSGFADDFGARVGVSGDTIIIGAQSRNGVYATVPWAWVYEFDGVQWKLQQRLEPSDGAGHRFGSDVDVDADTVIVGSGRFGRVYVYRRAAGIWTEEAKLATPDGKYIGEFVAVDGNTLASSSPSQAVAVFERGAQGSWSLVREVSSSPIGVLGWGVDVSAGTVVAGGDGAVVITRSATGQWGTVQVLPAPAGMPGFGNITVATNGWDVAVGGQGMTSVYLHRVRSPDLVPPLIAGAADRSPDSGSWYNGPVTVTWTSNDPAPSSGTPTIPPPTVLDRDGADQTATSGLSCDPAGNCATGVYGPVNIDSAVPTINGTASGMVTATGWRNQPTTVSFTCADLLSGIQDCSEATVLSEGADQSVVGMAADKAGNTSVSTVVDIDVDTTPPTITADATPAANQDGWHRSAVTVTFACTDVLSGVALCPAPIVVDTETTDHVVSATAADNAGNVAMASVVISIDATSPTITASLTPANAAGWNSSDVAVTFACADSRSGVDSCPATAMLTGEGTGLSTTGFATDRAGNSNSVTAVGINIDKTSPVLGAPSWTLNPKPIGGSQTPTATTLSVPATDPLAGVTAGEYFIGADPGVGHGASMSTASGALTASLGVGMPVGVYDVGVRARDAAGNWSLTTKTMLSSTIQPAQVLPAGTRRTWCRASPLATSYPG